MNLLRRPGRRSPQGQLDRLRGDVEALRRETGSELEAVYAHLDAAERRINALAADNQQMRDQLGGSFRGVARHIGGIERRVTALESARANAGGMSDLLAETMPASPAAADALARRYGAAAAQSVVDALGPGSGMHLTDKPEPVQWGADADITPIQEAAAEATQELRAAKGVA